MEAPTRANAPLISFDEGFGLVKINPLAAWSDEQFQEYIDANGVLNVAAMDKSAGKQNKITITNDKVMREESNTEARE